MAEGDKPQGGNRTVFHDLSRLLSDSERNEMLHSINKSLKMEAVSSEGRGKSSNEEELKQHLKQELAKIGLFERFVLWLKKIFSGKSSLTLMLDLKIDHLKRLIRKQSGAISGFETRDLKPLFAEQVWAVFEESLLLFHCFESLFGEKGLFRDLMISLFQNELSGSIKDASEIYPAEEMVELYRSDGSDESIRRRGTELLDEELEQVVDVELIARLERMVSPLIAADALVRFPFKGFFSAFGLGGVDPRDVYEATGKAPAFKSATAMNMLDQLEELYRALFRFVERCKDEPLQRKAAKAAAGICRIEAENEEAATELFMSNFTRFFDTASEFYQSTPLPELIRYFRRDPYYRIRIVHQRMNLKAFFRTTRKIIMREYIEEQLPYVREEATERNIREIFAEGDVERLKNYRTYQSISYDELGIPMFAYQRSLALLSAFCGKNYRNDIQESVRILDRGLYALNRVERDRLLMHATALEDVEEDIRKLDNSLSSDEADGKLFQRLRFSIAGDPGQQRLFRSLVQQKDHEASSIVRRGREAVEGLTRLFEDTLKIRNDAGLKALNQHYFVKSTPVSLRSILERNIATLRRFSFIMQQIKRMEP